MGRHSQAPDCCEYSAMSGRRPGIAASWKGAALCGRFLVDVEKIASGGDAAGVVVVAVLGLGGVEMTSDAEDRGIAEDSSLGRRDGKDDEEVALVGNFFSGEEDVREIEPSVAVGGGNDFDEFVREGAVGRVDELTIGVPGRRRQPSTSWNGSTE